MPFDPDSDNTQAINLDEWAAFMREARQRIDTDLWKDLPLLRGYRCSVCLCEVRCAPGGAVCAQGHGDAEEQGVPERAPFANMSGPVRHLTAGEEAVLSGLDDGQSGAVDDPFTVEAIPEQPRFRPVEEVAQLDAEAGYRPSPDQTAALDVLVDSLREGGEYTFSGRAGSGKTSTVRALLRRLTPAWQVSLLAPTWRAANRLREVTGQKTSSIHRAVYGRPVEQRQCPACGGWTASLMKHADAQVEVEGVMVKLPRYTCDAEGCDAQHEDATRFPHRLEFMIREEAAPDQEPPPYHLVVIDEASMVGPKVVGDCRKAFLRGGGAAILWVGDANQLPWVPEEGQAEGAQGVDLEHPTAALTTIHRQAAGDPILSLSDLYLTFPVQADTKWAMPRAWVGVHIEGQVPLHVPARWAASHRQAGTDSALIALSNATRAGLNHLIRQHTGAVAYAAQYGCNLIPGDRLLARGNSAGVYNGEVWTVCMVERVHPGQALLNEQGRGDVRHTLYEHDRKLEGGVAVLRVELAMVGHPDVRVHGVMALPLGTDGRELLESDLIRAGWEGGKARQHCRNVASAWAAEYKRCLEAREGEWAKRASDARDKRVAAARLLSSQERGDTSGVEDSLRRLARTAGVAGEPARRACAEKLARCEALTEGDLAGFASPYDVALECEGTAEYCRAVYGALDPSKVVIADFGECLTGHAMQGSQAEYVGVVVDGAVFGLWKHDRKGAMRWIYTAITRASKHLALFGIARAM